jgi:hypothetical protein
MMDFKTRRSLVLKATAQAEKVRIKCNLLRASTADPIDIADQRGCEVRFMCLPSLEGIYSPEPRGTIILGSERPAGRRNFTCAHELGHHEFKHGMRVEDLSAGTQETSYSMDEFLADAFAGILLMPKSGVLRELKKRNFDPRQIKPIQLFRLASFFGVGYTTLIEHMTWTLSLLSSHQRESLLKTVPKSFKIDFGGDPGFDLVIADEQWKNRAIDLEVGDILVLPQGATVEDGTHLKQQSVVDGQPVFKVINRGYSRAHSEISDWAANIRISPKKYVGLARYRFLDEPEEDNT